MRERLPSEVGEWTVCAEHSSIFLGEPILSSLCNCCLILSCSYFQVQHLMFKTYLWKTALLVLWLLDVNLTYMLAWLDEFANNEWLVVPGFRCDKAYVAMNQLSTVNCLMYESLFTPLSQPQPIKKAKNLFLSPRFQGFIPSVFMFGRQL